MLTVDSIHEPGVTVTGSPRSSSSFLRGPLPITPSVVSPGQPLLSRVCHFDAGFCPACILRKRSCTYPFSKAAGFSVGKFSLNNSWE